VPGAGSSGKKKILGIPIPTLPLTTSAEEPDDEEPEEK